MVDKRQTRKQAHNKTANKLNTNNTHGHNE